MLSLTRAAFSRRHGGDFLRVNRSLARQYVEQSRQGVRHRDELLNEIESAEISAVFEGVTGLPLDEDLGAAAAGDDCGPPTDGAGSAQRSTGARRARAAGKHDFQGVRGEFDEVGNFQSMRGRGRGTARVDYQDLTHEERQWMQHLEAQARLADATGLLNRHRATLDPRRDAKQLLRQMDSADADDELAALGEDSEDPRGALMVKENRFDEIVSRIRTQMRQEKVESSRVNKAKVPNFNGVIVDPIAKHVRRRCLRINALIRDHLEQIVTCNDPSFLLGDMKGVSISLKHVEMTSGKSTIKCYYTLLGDEPDAARVQAALERAQKRVRFCLARKLELGYTPPVAFIRAADADLACVRRLARSPEGAFNLPLETSATALREQFHRRMVAF